VKSRAKIFFFSKLGQESLDKNQKDAVKHKNCCEKLGCSHMLPYLCAQVKRELLIYKLQSYD